MQWRIIPMIDHGEIMQRIQIERPKATLSLAGAWSPSVKILLATAYAIKIRKQNELYTTCRHKSPFEPRFAQLNQLLTTFVMPRVLTQ